MERGAVAEEDMERGSREPGALSAAKCRRLCVAACGSGSRFSTRECGLDHPGLCGTPQVTLCRRFVGQPVAESARPRHTLYRYRLRPSCSHRHPRRVMACRPSCADFRQSKVLTNSGSGTGAQVAAGGG